MSSWPPVDADYRCGVLMRGGNGSYAEMALQNDIDHGVRVKRLHSSTELAPHFPIGLKLGKTLMSDFEGYLNCDGGWANAKQGVELAMARIRRLGGRIEPDKCVCEISSDGLGVKLEDGTVTRANLIVIASGSWTPSAFPGLDVAQRVVATG